MPSKAMAPQQTPQQTHMPPPPPSPTAPMYGYPYLTDGEQVLLHQVMSACHQRQKVGMPAPPQQSIFPGYSLAGLTMDFCQHLLLHSKNEASGSLSMHPLLDNMIETARCIRFLIEGLEHNEPRAVNAALMLLRGQESSAAMIQHGLAFSRRDANGSSLQGPAHTESHTTAMPSMTLSSTTAPNSLGSTTVANNALPPPLRITVPTASTSSTAMASPAKSPSSSGALTDLLNASLLLELHENDRSKTKKTSPLASTPSTEALAPAPAPSGSSQGKPSRERKLSLASMLSEAGAPFAGYNNLSTPVNGSEGQVRGSMPVPAQSPQQKLPSLHQAQVHQVASPILTLPQFRRGLPQLSLPSPASSHPESPRPGFIMPSVTPHESQAINALVMAATGMKTSVTPSATITSSSMSMTLPAQPSSPVTAPSLSPQSSTTKAPPRRWTREEDGALRDAVGKYGERNWKAIAAQVPGRNHTQCLQRWTKVLQPGLIKGHWSPDEDELLRTLVSQNNKNWGQVAAKIPGRTSKQCRERWHNHLDPSIKRSPYTPEEDRTIIESHARLGNRWAQIAAMLPGRTEDAVKIRWKSFLRSQKGGKPPRQRGFSTSSITSGPEVLRSPPSNSSSETDSDSINEEKSIGKRSRSAEQIEKPKKQTKKNKNIANAGAGSKGSYKGSVVSSGPLKKKAKVNHEGAKALKATTVKA